jgi:hypothetical protein
LPPAPTPTSQERQASGSPELELAELAASVLSVPSR